MSLFEQKIVNQYTSKIREILKDRRILTASETLQYLRIDRADAKLAAAHLSLICKNLNAGYAEEELTLAFMGDTNDASFIIGNAEITEEDEVDRFNKSIANIHGLIIAKKPYCEELPNAYAVVLVCANNSPNAGAILIGLYLYSIMCHDDVDQFGVLDVASSYTNLNAICLYSKFGFTIDHTLYLNQCFEDYTNLALSVNLTGIDKKHIIDIVTKTEPGYDKLPICRVEPRYQIAIGALENLKLLMDEFRARCIKRKMRRNVYKFKQLILDDVIIFDDVNLIIATHDLVNEVMNKYRSPHDFTKQITIVLFQIELDALLILLYKIAFGQRMVPADVTLVHDFLARVERRFEPIAPSPRELSPVVPDVLPTPPATPSPKTPPISRRTRTTRKRK